ncbi:hypothetical protein CPC16_003719 [Podila verticillata]|nr:hypothetical protein CPC16_003719 [Podila verticillata]
MDLLPSYSTLTAPYMEVARVCVITLNENDKIRLIATSPELVQAVRQVQREQDYADAHEFKLEGYPWQGDGKESVMCRRLLTHIMRNMAAYGWSLIQAVDMSKKQMDKDSFFFELRPVVDFKADLFAISFNKSDGIRVVDAPQVVLAVRQAIVAQWKEGIQHEKEYEGSIEFKLLGNPFYSDRHGAVGKGGQRSTPPTAHGKEGKPELGQNGSSWQPDIVGCTAGGKEIYFGELKGIHATKQDVNVDILRLTIFAKDALDHLRCFLAEDPPLLTFKTKGRAVVFFLAAKQGNAIVHTRMSSVELPSKLSELNLNQEFFFRPF